MELEDIAAATILGHTAEARGIAHIAQFLTSESLPAYARGVASSALAAARTALVALGHRATVRELWILFARMVFGRGERGEYRYG